MTYLIFKKNFVTSYVHQRSCFFIEDPGFEVLKRSSAINTFFFTLLAFTKLAKILKKVFLKLMKQEFPPEVPIKDEDFLETSTQNKRQKTSKKSKKLDRTDNMNLQKAKDKTEKELSFQPWNVAKPKSSDCVTYLSQNKTGTVSSSNVQLPTVYKDRLIQISCAPTAQTGLKHPRKYITPAQIQKLFAQNHTSMAGISLSSNTVVLHSQPLAVKKGRRISYHIFFNSFFWLIPGFNATSVGGNCKSCRVI